MVNGVRSTRGKMALFQPLTLLDMVVYHRENANINRIKEVKCLYPYETLNRDFRKSSIALFLTEVLNKTIKEESHSKEIFHFISESLIQLDQMPNRFENFHLNFLIRLSRVLGFGIHSAKELEAEFQGDEESLNLLDKLLNETWHQLPINVQQRRKLLIGLLSFYRSNLEEMGDLKSVQIIREILD